MELVRQDHVWKWVIVMCGLFLSFLTDGVRFSFGLTYQELLDEFDKSKGATAGIGSLMFAVMNFSAPLASVLINKYSCRFTTILGSVIYCIGLIATTLTPNFYVLYLSFGIICGIGYSMMYVPVSVIILQYFDRQKSLANGIAMCGSGIGGFVFNPLLNSLFDTYAWRGALLVTSGIVLHGAVAGALMRPNRGDVKKEQLRNATQDSAKETLISKAEELSVKSSNQQEDHKMVADAICVSDPARPNSIFESSNIPKVDSQEIKEIYSKRHIEPTSNDCRYVNVRHNDKTDLQLNINETGASMLPYKQAVKNQSDEQPAINTMKSHPDSKKGLFAWYILKDPKFICFMVSQFFLAVAYMIPFTYLPEVVIALGYSRKNAVWLMSTISIVSTVSRAASGWLADRKCVNRRMLYCAATFVCALAVLSLFLWRQYELIMMASLVYALTTGCIITLIAVTVSDMFGSQLMSDAYGLSIFARGPGNFSGPTFSGRLGITKAFL